MAWPYTRRWQLASKAFLQQHPLCECPLCDGGKKRIRPASVVDHKIPHRGDMELFWDQDNWQSMAKDCHDSVKQALEKTGRIKGCDEQGRPLDPSDPWRQAADAEEKK